jgi:formiminoglutamate deiminase
MTDASYWCEHAWLGGLRAVAGVTIDVVDDRIGAIRSDVAHPPTGAIRLDGLTLPAFANAHSHAFHRALRGRTHDGRGSFWTWRDLMYSVAGRLEPDRYHDLARAVFAEMAVAGVGVVGEFHYVHHQADGAPYADPNEMGRAVVAAALEAGVRLTLLDTLYLHGGFGNDTNGYGALRDEQLRFGDRSAEAWAERVAGLIEGDDQATVSIGAAIHSVRAVDPAAMKVVAGWSAAADAPLHVHVSEQPAENDNCIDRFGISPTALLDHNDVLTDRTTIVHATHSDEDDIDRMARAGAACCLCPTTERDLADGIGPSVGLVAAGVDICLGSDAHAVIDLLEEARAVELDERLRSHQRGLHRADELAAMATEHGYASLGWSDGGRLSEGCLADFTTIGLESVRLAGADAGSVIASAIFAGSAADVRDVVVAGRHIVRNGLHATIDVPSELRHSIEAVMAR